MRMKFHRFCPSGVKSPRSMIFNILHIHSQTMSEAYSPTNRPNPVPLTHHLSNLAKLITLSLTQRCSKVRYNLIYLKINNEFGRLCFTLLYIKIYPSKQRSLQNYQPWRYSSASNQLVVDFVSAKNFVMVRSQVSVAGAHCNRLKRLSSLRLGLFL